MADQINIQFADKTKKVVVGYFASPQNPDEYPFQDVIGTDDVRWAAYYNATPEPARRGLPAPVGAA